ncbi:MAG: hypothetical protein QM811_20940 [Pirellulales bacterium]
MRKVLPALAILICLTQSALAALVLNSALPVDKRVTVQLIQVADDAGANAAPLFGSPAQQSIIFDYIDQIWGKPGSILISNFVRRRITTRSH